MILCTLEKSESTAETVVETIYGSGMIVIAGCVSM